MFIFQKNVLCLPQNLHDRIIMLRIMREGAARAILDPSAIFLEIPGIPGAVQSEVLYVGDAVYDYQCARNAGVDFGLALWGNVSSENICPRFAFDTPESVLELIKDYQ